MSHLPCFLLAAHQRNPALKMITLSQTEIPAWPTKEGSPHSLCPSSQRFSSPRQRENLITFPQKTFFCDTFDQGSPQAVWVADALPGRVSHSVTGPPQTPPWPQQQDKQKTNKYSAQINVQLENTEVVVSSPPITPSPKLGASSSPPALLTKALCTQK